MERKNLTFIYVAFISFQVFDPTFAGLCTCVGITGLAIIFTWVGLVGVCASWWV
jgi:hypothetical protein